MYKAKLDCLIITLTGLLETFMNNTKARIKKMTIYFDWNLLLNISTIAIFNRKLEWCWLWATPRIPAMCPLAANLIRWAAVVHADFLIRFAVDGGLSFNLGCWVVWRNSCIRWESCESKNNGKERQFWHFWGTWLLWTWRTIENKW